MGAGKWDLTIISFCAHSSLRQCHPLSIDKETGIQRELLVNVTQQKQDLTQVCLVPNPVHTPKVKFAILRAHWQ